MPRDFEFNPEAYAIWEERHREDFRIYVTTDIDQIIFRCYDLEYEILTIKNGKIKPIQTNDLDNRKCTILPKDQLLKLIALDSSAFMSEEMKANNITKEDLNGIISPEEISILFGTTLK